jgi:spore coat polysaccharide biosynthesis protein SpsF
MEIRRSKPNVVMIIQARMGSIRLPGKSMMDLAGAPLVGRIIERVKRCQTIDQIILATTKEAEDNVLEKLALDDKVFSFRGSDNDLVDRYYQAAKIFKADVIVRLPADNPTPEPSEIDRIVNYHLTGQSDFSSNLAQVFENGYPDGIGAEVFGFDVLEEVWQAGGTPEQREHLHLNFFDYASQQLVDPDKYQVGTVQCPVEFRRPDLVLDVNTQKEYEFMVELYQYLYPRDSEFHITDIIDWYDNTYQ